MPTRTIITRNPTSAITRPDGTRRRAVPPDQARGLRDGHGAPGARGNRAAAAVSALLALALIALAAPQVPAALAVLPHEDVLPRLARGERVVLPELGQAVAAHRTAVAWHDSARLHQRLGQLHFAVALRAATVDGRRAALARSVEAHAAAVARDPSRAYAWTQLALARLELEGASPAFAEAYARAVAVAPSRPQLLFPRAQLGLVAWPRLDAATRDLVAAQVTLAAEADPARLLAAAGGANRRLLLLRILADRPDLRAALERRQRRTPRAPR